MKIHLLSGFLGSGKTTAIQQAASILIQQGIKVGVITNDQGVKLVDGNLFTSLDIPSRQVVNGCFCCNYNELDGSIESLIESNKPEVIFAESVGSCTDIIATVMKPLLRYRSNISVTVSTFADARLLHMLLSGNSTSFDASVIYIYNKQLEEAAIIVINKIDLMNASDLKDVKNMMFEIYGDKKLIFQNSLDAGNVDLWLQTLEDTSFTGELSSLEINYNVYGAGEAMLAWLDQEIEIFSSSNTAVEDAYELMNLIYEKIVERKYAIGHLKFLLDNTIKVSFTSTQQKSPDPDVEKHFSSSATLLINARVQTTPDDLSELVTDAIKELSSLVGCTIVVVSVASFQPGYPRPTHRIAE